MAEVINAALRPRPTPPTGRSGSMSEHCGVSKSTVSRAGSSCSACSRTASGPFERLSNDPFFIEKVRDIVGLYLNRRPTRRGACVDETQTQIQALERTQPMLPMGLGLGCRRRHPRLRSGCTPNLDRTFFAPRCFWRRQPRSAQPNANGPSSGSGVGRGRLQRRVDPARRPRVRPGRPGRSSSCNPSRPCVSRSVRRHLPTVN